MSSSKNQYKSGSSKPPKKAKSKASGMVEKLTGPVRKFFNDERFHKISGLLLILISAFLLVAFTSFLFTWKVDQDKLFGASWSVMGSTDVQIDNWLGSFGALISHQFIHNWFGLSSFIFILLFFLLGFKILFKISLLPLVKTFKFSFFALLWLSTALGAIFSDSFFFMGGALGFHTNKWMSSIFGTIGTTFLIIFALLIFVVLNFNVSFERMSKVVEVLFARLSGKDELEKEEAEVGPQQSDDGFDLVTSNAENTAIAKKTPVEPTPAPVSEPAVGLTLETETPTAPITAPPPVVEEIPEGAPIELDTVVPPSAKGPADDDADLQLDIEKVEVKEEILSEKEIDKKIQEFGEYDPLLDLSKYQFPGIDMLADHGDGSVVVDREELEANKNRIVETLRNYNIEISKIKATIGPTVTLYEIVPAAGVRISKIKNLEDDIALSLSALGIRIIAPIPGKGTIGIEVPNLNPDVVSMRTVIASEKFQNSDMALPIALGKTIQNETFVTDLAKMPHLLMAGATGQGKSVGLNAILASLLYKKHPAQVKFVLVDPKKVELTLFNKIERHFLAKLPDSEEAIITDTSKVVATVNSLCIEMDNRYEMLKNAQVRNIKEYNAKFVARKLNPENGHKYLPYIVLVVDEFADLIMTAGKEVEQPIARLAQLARAIGIHLIIATQRPSVNIITGTIKANFPSRIAFRVTSKIDSRTILDTGGAEQLIGRGDMLFSNGSELIRLQCAFVDTPEVEEITEFIGNQQGYSDAFLLPEYVDESASQSTGDIAAADRDVLFEDAARTVVLHQQGSASLLQRKLKLGYNRAGRIVDQLEAAGIIGPFEGSKARQVLIPDELSLEQFLTSERES